MQGIVMTYNGLTLGDGSNYYISDLDPGQLPNRQADQLAAGRDGGFIFNQNYGMRLISFTVNVFSNNDTQFFTDIQNLRTAFSRSNSARELNIQYWDGHERSIDAFVYQFPNPIHTPGNTDKTFNVRIILIAAYPFYSGGSSDIETATLELDQSLGFNYPMTYPFDYAAGSSNSSYTFTNDGDVPALLSIVFNGPVITPTLTNASQGTAVQINTTVIGGIAVTLEYTSSGRVIQDQNGVSYEPYFIGSTAFFFVPLGTNIFTFSASTYNATASCDITLTKYYLS